MTAAARLTASSPLRAENTSNGEALVEAIAQRVVELLREEPVVDAGAAGPVLWTTARVAAELGFSAEWVRDHRHELGLVTTSGARPRLMFEAAAVRSWATAREGARGPGERSQEADIPVPRASRRSRSAASRSSVPVAVDLLPIRGSDAA